VVHRAASQQHAVLPAADDLAVLDDDGAERPAQPFSTDSMASLVASCMNLIWPLAGTALAGVTENPAPATPMAAAAAAVRVKNARRPASVRELQVQRFMFVSFAVTMERCALTRPR